MTIDVDDLATWASWIATLIASFAAGLRKGRKGYLLPRARFYFSVRPGSREDGGDDGDRS